MKCWRHFWWLTLLSSQLSIAAETEVHALVGPRWTWLDHQGSYQGFEFSGSLLRALPGFPIAGGPTFSWIDFHNRDFPGGADAFFGYELGLQGMFWLPDPDQGIRGWRPFATYGFSIHSSYLAEGIYEHHAFRNRYDCDDTKVGLGVNLAFDPAFRILAVATQQYTRWRVKKGAWPRNVDSETQATWPGQALSLLMGIALEY